LATLSLCRSST